MLRNGNIEIAGRSLANDAVRPELPHAKVDVVPCRHLRNPTGLAPDGLLTCFRDRLSAQWRGRVAGSMLTCRRPPCCMPHSHGWSYRSTVSSAAHATLVASGTACVDCIVACQLVLASGTRSRSQVSFEDRRTAHDSVLGTGAQQRQGWAGGPPNWRCCWDR